MGSLDPVLRAFGETAEQKMLGLIEAVTSSWLINAIFPAYLSNQFKAFGLEKVEYFNHGCT